MIQRSGGSLSTKRQASHNGPVPTICKHHASLLLLLLLLLLLRESDDLAGEVGARWIPGAAKRM